MSIWAKIENETWKLATQQWNGDQFTMHASVFRQEKFGLQNQFITKTTVKMGGPINGFNILGKKKKKTTIRIFEDLLSIWEMTNMVTVNIYACNKMILGMLNAE